VLLPSGDVHRRDRSSTLRVKSQQPVEKPLYASSGSPSKAQKPPLQCFGLDI
jgi:hypothetical protein